MAKKQKMRRGLRRGTVCLAFAAAAMGIGGGCSAMQELTEPVTPPNPPTTLPTTLPADSTCVQNTDVAEGQPTPPELQDSFNLLEGLPIMGQPVYDVVTAAEHNIYSCIVPDDALDSDIAGHYLMSKNLMEVRESYADPGTFAHENFHAVQDVNGSFDDNFNAGLTMEDSIAANLLAEANAVAYSYTAYQEALLFHLDMDVTPPPIPHDMEIEDVFYGAFTAMWEGLEGADSDTRRVYALEAGGQAVTDALLNGESAFWTNHYAALTVQNVNNASTNKTNERRADNYEAVRDRVFEGLDHVSDSVNMTPHRFSDPQTATAAAQQTLARNGITITYS